jgi:hypothetical protein
MVDVEQDASGVPGALDLGAAGPVEVVVHLGPLEESVLRTRSSKASRVTKWYSRPS